MVDALLIQIGNVERSIRPDLMSTGGPLIVVVTGRDKSLYGTREVAEHLAEDDLPLQRLDTKELPRYRRRQRLALVNRNVCVKRARYGAHRREVAEA